ncbi:site-2 protease [Limnobacter thiooxidans]|uniref:Zinc metalloprotease n=1 Tax=Limnobacter thiooxidans TaxID=131080 RepID=A0AA86J1Y5_9BURK|nr:RIP metalloprotease RseP [Limnobacter sp.]MCZ8015379.1 RIP metalloprotease RseP [Limnobacter sp.]RZS42462.1 site-2 protease [Limnobacter thiooxidans]BET26101.1 RIP metalloprotease RseP [Limnobacter thiooxidans]
MLNSIVSFLVALGILVFIHEYGHYAVARFYGVRVIRFSVGFGKPIVRWVNQKTKVEWTISWIPLGGYVRMLDERDPDSLKGHDIDLSESFNRKPVGQRIAVVLAGPLANLILAALIYGFLAYMQPLGLATRVAQPPPNSQAAAIGLQMGDTVIRVNGEDTKNWSEVSWALVKARLFQNDVSVQVNRDNTLVDLAPVSGDQFDVEIGPNLIRELGFNPVEKSVLVRAVNEGSPAAVAGFQSGDILIRVNDVPVETSAQFTELVKRFPEQQIAIEILRNQEQLMLSAVPQAFRAENGESVGRLGLSIGGESFTVNHPLTVLESFTEGVGRMVEVSVFSLAALGKMVTGDLSWNHLSGPVSIASAAGESSSLGILPFFGFLAMVSVSLGILNLLPIPLLDGGHLMYYLAEIVRGKPVDEIWQIRGQKLGILLIGVLTGVAFFNDIQRLL